METINIAALAAQKVERYDRSLQFWIAQEESLVIAQHRGEAGLEEAIARLRAKADKAGTMLNAWGRVHARAVGHNA